MIDPRPLPPSPLADGRVDDGGKSFPPSAFFLFFPSLGARALGYLLTSYSYFHFLCTVVGAPELRQGSLAHNKEMIGRNNTSGRIFFSQRHP